MQNWLKSYLDQAKTFDGWMVTYNDNHPCGGSEASRALEKALVAFIRDVENSTKQRTKAMTPDRYALMWVLDRLTVDEISQREVDVTAEEIRKLLKGEPNRASTYSPNSRDESVRAIRRATQ